MAPQQSGGNNQTNYGSLPAAAAEATTNRTTKTQETLATEESYDYTSSVGNALSSSSREPPSNEYVLNVAFLSFVGFMGVQAFFALVANSESMLADSEAMSVDALTYLFNMWAERIKNRPPTAEELQLPLAVREHRIEMKRLYLELIPPLISVVTLILVTIGALREASETLFGEAEGDDDDNVSAGLMLFFSALNLLLDVVNVTCFARAHQAYGLQKTSDEINNNNNSGTYYFRKHEEEAQQLVERDEQASGLTLLQGSDMALSDHLTHDDYLESWFGNVNLNMCSAWTVRTAFCRERRRVRRRIVGPVRIFQFKISNLFRFDLFCVAHLCRHDAKCSCLGGRGYCFHV